MATELKIKVTKDILKRSMYCGTSGGSSSIDSNCAIALAIRDIFPNASVGKYRILPNFYGELIHYTNDGKDFSHHDVSNKIALPEEATNFIGRFDSLSEVPEKRLEMEELEFTVEVPDSLVDQIDISHITKVLGNHPTLELTF